MLRLFLILAMFTSLNSQNNNRVVMLFADQNSQRQLQLQQQLLAADKKGCDEREIIVKVYSPADVDVYKKNNIIKKGFTMLLIGKDGGEKLRSHVPITTQKLFALIDAMPMRKEVISHSGGYGE